jgi:fumarate reductase flavoprotein subunit
MNNHKKIIFLSTIFFALLVLTACGNLSDENSIWNQTRDVESSNTPDGAMSYTPGTFEATSSFAGYYARISVAVTIDANGRITDIEVTDHDDTPGFADPAFAHLIPSVIEAQSADVDAFTGATASSNAFLDAVSIALNKAGGTSSEVAEANFTPGTFEATSSFAGYYARISVAVTIDSDGRISDIVVTDHDDTPGFADPAFAHLIPTIIGAQSADVDAFTGATATSNAFLDAVRIALDGAQ